MNQEAWDFDKTSEQHPLPDACAHTIEAVKAAVKPAKPFDNEEMERLAQHIIGALKTVYDPEIPVDIFELGLIYKINVDDDRNVEIDMTLTAPGCPVAGEMPVWVQNAVGAVEGVGQVKVNLVFDPPWTIDRMSEEARVELDLF
jgi:FeS assembly SUF system protein